MQTKNDTPKPETELKQETGEGCSGATCSVSCSSCKRSNLHSYTSQYGIVMCCWCYKKKVKQERINRKLLKISSQNT